MSIKKQFEALHNALLALKGHRILQVVVVACFVFPYLILYYYGLDMLNHFQVDLKQETFTGWAMAITVIAFLLLLVLMIRYIIADDDRKSFFVNLRDMGPITALLALSLLLFGSMSFKSNWNTAIQIATALALVLTAIGFVESSVLGKRVVNIFGFHDYFKNGVRLYKSADKWLYSVVGNWEISKGLEDVLTYLGEKTAKSAEPIKLKFCGPINSQNLIGVFWRCGVVQNIPPECKIEVEFHSPKVDNTIRFTANEDEVLLASTPTQEKRDLYGFLYWDKELPEVYKGIYQSVTGGEDKALSEIYSILSVAHNDRTNPSGLRDLNHIKNYSDNFLLPELKRYLEKSAKEKINHEIDTDIEKSKAVDLMEKGLRHFLSIMQKKGWLKMTVPDNEVTDWTKT